MTKPLAGVFGANRELADDPGTKGPRELTVLTCDGCEYLRDDGGDKARCLCPDVVDRSGGKLAFMSSVTNGPVWFVSLEVMWSRRLGGTLRIIRPSPICPFAVRPGKCKLSETV